MTPSTKHVPELRSTLSPRARALRSCSLLAVTVLLGMAILPALPVMTSAADEGPAPRANRERPANTLDLMIGRSTVIHAPWAVKTISVADEKIADVNIAAPDQVVVLGKSPGSTDIFLWSEDGQMIQRRVDVEADLGQLEGSLGTFFPTADLRIDQNQDFIVVRGVLRRSEHSLQLRQLLGASGIKFIDMTSVAGVHQVQIQVRVAEASRQAVRALGINAFVGGDRFFGASTIGGNPNLIDIGVPADSLLKGGLPFGFNSATSVGNAVTLFGGFPNSELQFFLEALADNQYMRVLAEPTLVALSGEEASFLAGGEFPVPIVQGTTTGGGTSISVEYKEFGVRLRFHPTVLGDGTIRLHVAPEVSDVSDFAAVVLEGFRIPSILTRRAETTLEMTSGQTFAMAGLMDRSVVARAQKVPGLGDLPILGSLFRSVRYEQGQTELVVLCTVELVEPLTNASNRPVPGDLHTMPDDWELYAEGRIEGKAAPKLSPSDTQWLKKMGLDRLVGPGAWETYEKASQSAPHRRGSDRDSQPGAEHESPTTQPAEPDPLDRAE